MTVFSDGDMVAYKVGRRRFEGVVRGRYTEDCREIYVYTKALGGVDKVPVETIVVHQLAIHRPPE